MFDVFKGIKSDKVKTEYFRHLLLEAARNGEHIYQNMLNKINNLPCVRESEGKVTLRTIFIEYWDFFAVGNEGKIRPAVKDNVEAMMHCKDFSKGYLTYECPNCHKLVNIGLSCNSRFCASCGNRYREQRALAISKKVISKPHRQFVFSIAKQLRQYFAETLDRDALLDILFNSVEFAFSSLIQGNNKKAKKENRQFGYMLFLHTYGRDIKWNPHIHALICEGYFDKFNKYHKYDYFPYVKLRMSFMYELHNAMKDYIKSHKSDKEFSKFCKLVKWLEKKYPQGYYAYGPKINKKYDNRLSVKNLTKYIARYASHPAIAESRILKLDLTNHMVKYYYDPHEDDVLDEDDPNRLGRQYVEESVFEFMKKLVRHIPNKGFHNIRYYGFYSKRSTIDTSSISPLYSTSELNKIKQNINWNKKMKLTYGYEPLLCICGSRMEFCPELSFFPDKRGKPKQLSFDDYDEEGNLYAEEFYYY